RRWLAGEPIRARPVGRLERLVRWARRRPAAAALVVVSAVAALALVGLGVAAVFNDRLQGSYRAEAEARQAGQAERQNAEQALGAAEAAQRGETKQRQSAEAAQLREKAQRLQAEKARALAEKAKRGEEEERKKAQEALMLAERVGYRHSIFLADLALREHNVPR